VLEKGMGVYTPPGTYELTAMYRSKSGEPSLRSQCDSSCLIPRKSQIHANPAGQNESRTVGAPTLGMPQR
jgi:hypothetical protein